MPALHWTFSRIDALSFITVVPSYYHLYASFGFRFILELHLWNHLHFFMTWYHLITQKETGSQGPGCQGRMSQGRKSQRPGSQFQNPKILGPRVSGLRISGLRSQGPGSWVSGLDFRLCWKKSLVNFKIHDVTIWLTNNYNTHNAQYLTN